MSRTSKVVSSVCLEHVRFKCVSRTSKVVSSVCLEHVRLLSVCLEQVRWCLKLDYETILW